MREEDKKERLERQYLLFTQPLFSPRPTKSATNNNNNASQTTKAFLRRLFFIF
jgi:hypothetical protein